VRIGLRAWRSSVFSEFGTQWRNDGEARLFFAFQGGCTIVQIGYPFAFTGAGHGTEKERESCLDVNPFAQRILHDSSPVQLRFGVRGHLFAWGGQR
jgi:hypothetical protein